MANSIVQFDAPEGLTLTGKLYALNGDTIINGAGGDSATERTNNLGRYTITVTEALTGSKELRVTDSSNVTISTYITDVLVDDTGTYNCFDRTSPLAAAAIADALWDEAMADHVIAGSAGYFVGSIGTVTFTYSSASIVGGGTVNIKAGDYLTFTLTSDTADVVPDLTGITCRFGVKQGDRQLIETTSVVVDTATGLQAVTVTILPAETLTLGAQNAIYDLQAEYSATDHRTLISGTCVITDDRSGS